MSERRARLERKEEVIEEQHKKTDSKKILFNVISVLVVVAIVGLSAFAIVSKKMNSQSAETTEQTAEQTNADANANVDTSTLKGVAEAQGMTFEELKEKWGLGDNFTEDTPSEEASNMFTLENMAKISDTTIDEFKKQYNLDDSVKTDVAVGELETSVMLKASGIPYTLEDLRAYDLPAEITETTLWKDSYEAVTAAAQAKASAEQAAQAENTEGKDAQNTEEADKDAE